MTSTAASILIVDDEPDVFRGFERIFASEPWRLLSANSGEEAVRVFAEHRPEVVVMDLRMPKGDGLEALRAIRRADPRALVILMTAFGTTQTAIEAMKAGAYEYLQKPFNVEKIRQVVREAVRAAREMHQVVSYEPLLGEEEHDEEIIGRTEAMQEIYKQIGQVAGTDAPVLITGESGTGKELVARAIYHHSRRADHPFLAVNCAAIPEALLESELFGHERGAFTGAVSRRPGKFEAADGGTLFLDEIGDMSAQTQAKVLRALQNGEVKRVGANTPIRVDVRVIAATNRDLENSVRQGAFRADLFYRLNVFRIRMPPLRERMDDLPLLIERFLRKYGGEKGREGSAVRAEAEVIERLRAHTWPGNIRELENAIRTALLRVQGGALLASHLPPLGENAAAATPGGLAATGPASAGKTAPQAAAVPQTAPPQDAATSPPPSPHSATLRTEEIERMIEPLFERLVSAGAAEAARTAESSENSAGENEDMFDLVERSLVILALRRCAGNQARAARLLGINRSTLRKRIARYGLAIETRIESLDREENES